MASLLPKATGLDYCCFLCGLTYGMVLRYFFSRASQSVFSSSVITSFEISSSQENRYSFWGSTLPLTCGVIIRAVLSLASSAVRLQSA